MEAVVCELTPDVFTVNVAEVKPVGTVIDVGTVAAELPLDRATDVPPGPA